jgi:hypothetical protein
MVDLLTVLSLGIFKKADKAKDGVKKLTRWCFLNTRCGLERLYFEFACLKTTFSGLLQSEEKSG